MPAFDQQLPQMLSQYDYSAIRVVAALLPSFVFLLSEMSDSASEQLGIVDCL